MFDGSAIATISVEPGAVDRDDLVLLADLARDELEDLGVDLVLVEVDRRDAVLLGEEVGELLVA